ncbi:MULTISPECIES: YbaB/EbfC family nucleoid-associated protein [Chitinophaga]|uniref:YbaB/EbfC family nucleoid-associated protein n=1 Tax=Chitinophaga TaxID=79328 RepID=UPI0009F9A71C|nr:MULTISPECIES: YbaB/EbfC family nucleoid-associated protein [Chitinophaga]WPQ64307.1 YbaB/EbfC family nucleoid-associated protein [Chitinophaga sancti]
MFDMFGKLQEAQQKMKESKERLALITVDGEAGDGAVKVTVTGNREVKSLEIAERLLEKDHKEELEDLVITALNRALKAAENTWESEMKSVAGGMLGPLGGLLG